MSSAGTFYTPLTVLQLYISPLPHSVHSLIFWPLTSITLNYSSPLRLSRPFLPPSLLFPINSPSPFLLHFPLLFIAMSVFSTHFCLPFSPFNIRFCYRHRLKLKKTLLHSVYPQSLKCLRVWQLFYTIFLRIYVCCEIRCRYKHDRYTVYRYRSFDWILCKTACLQKCRTTPLRL